MPAAKEKGSGGSTIIKSEDWMTVWLGFLIILLVLFGLRFKTPTFRWMGDGGFQSVAAESSAGVDKLLKAAQDKNETDLVAAATGLKAALAGQERKAIGDAAKKLGAAPVQDAGLKKQAAGVSRKLSGDSGATLGKVFSGENLWTSILIGAGFLILAAIGNALMGRSVGKFLVGFPAVFILTWLSLFIAGNTTVTYYGLEFALWALVLGLFISNVLGLPAWMKEAVRTEYYIKVGLVIMGAGILFGEILQAGAYGVIQSIVVVVAVWYFAYWLAQKLRVDDEFSAMLATAVSICGVSAAIAAAGAIQGDKKKLSYTTSIVLVIAVPMMILMPILGKAIGLPELVAGAWIGGTIDTTGAVVAAGALYGDAAMKVATIVKFSQNVLIGFAAFLLAIAWTVKRGAETGERPSAMVIWERFPKFVLGFLVASLVFSFFLSQGTIDLVKGPLGFIRLLTFALAFVCIGLETNFKELLQLEGGRPAAAFLGAQAFNIVWTLVLAFLLFGGILFSAPVIK
ncbi:MAG TPA: putative sulfate exporter family transporter [Candidatus Methylomirabilis sp.]|nr:putative sulfate exporter family transporter [Candidatus Methylomirabilis sp.]HSB81715.1 putative sulfate exporter family transporter [Candidatus Methylomirabilis sp.]